MSVIDSPDGQRISAGPQKLVGSIVPPATSVTVEVPTNATSLLLFTRNLWVGALPTFVGVTTHTNYQASFIDGAFVAPLVSVVDALVLVTIPGVVANTCYVVAETTGQVTYAAIEGFSASGDSIAYGGARAMLVAGSDGASARFMRVDSQGEAFVHDSVPNTGSGDHPTSEIKLAALNGLFNASGSPVLNAPGAGKRIRVYRTEIFQYTGTVNGISLNATYNGSPFAINFTGYTPDGTNSGYRSKSTIPKTGLPLDANTGMTVNAVIGNASAIVNVYYSVETI